MSSMTAGVNVPDVSLGEGSPPIRWPISAADRDSGSEGSVFSVLPVKWRDPGCAALVLSLSPESRSR